MIFSVEKRKRRVKGKVKKSESYYLRYRFGDMPRDKWHCLNATEKSVAEEKAKEFRSEWEHAQIGMITPKKRAAAWNLPFAELVAEYRAELTTRGRDARYIDITCKRIASVGTKSQWKKLGDATGDSFMIWRRGQNLKGKTLNDYLSSVGSFFQWLVDLERLERNPMTKVPPVSTDGEEPEERRAFTTVEFDRLCAVSGKRTIVYQLTLFCGLRRDEAAQLIWGDVLTARDGAMFLKLRKSTVKNGKTVNQPVPGWLAELIRTHKAESAKLSDCVFESIPSMPRFYKDLDAAKIPRIDERGHHSKFHSLRHTFGTWLWVTGADPRVIMKLMRHSDLNLTTRRYTDEAGLACDDAVSRLPVFASIREWTQIGTQISDISGQNVSQAGESDTTGKALKSLENKGFGRPLTGAVASDQLVHAVGFEPTTPSV